MNNFLNGILGREQHHHISEKNVERDESPIDETVKSHVFCSDRHFEVFVRRNVVSFQSNVNMKVTLIS